MNQFREVEELLLKVGFQKVLMIGDGQIATVDGTICDEQGCNTWSCKNDARIYHNIISRKDKYKKWCQYWISRGRTPVATVRLANEYPNGWAARKFLSIIGVGLI